MSKSITSVRVTELMSPRHWRDRYAYGLLLGEVTRIASMVGQAGDRTQAMKKKIQELPDDVIRWHLRAAASELEMKLGLKFNMQIVKSLPIDEGLKIGQDYDLSVPRQAFSRAMQESWCRIDLPETPVLSVERVRAWYGDQLLWELSAEHGLEEVLTIAHPKQGTIHLMPFWSISAAAFPSLSMNSGVLTYMRRMWGMMDPIPGYWGVDFTTGPSTGGMPNEIPAVLADWCYSVASLKLLQIGALGITKGVSGGSTSIDGISRSVNFNPSGLYANLERALQTTIDRIDWKQIRLSMRGILVRPYGG